MLITVVPVPSVQEAGAHGTHVRDAVVAAHHQAPRPLDPARRRHTLRHQMILHYHIIYLDSNLCYFVNNI